MGKRLVVIGAAAMALLLSGCGYNTLQKTDEQIKAAWAEVVNQYQRRSDLIPNLVNTVKGFAAQEQQVLLGVTNARAKVGTIQATPELINDPQAFTRFQQAQGELSSALSRLMVVVEKYPELKATANFLDLQKQLEGTENRISVERMRFNEAAQAFDTKRQSFPTVIIAGFLGDRFKEKPYFKAQAGAEAAPKVKF